MTFVEKIIALAKKKVVLVGGVSLIAFAAGSGSGFVYAKKKLSAEYEQLLSEEMGRAREFFKRQNKRDEYKTPGDAVEALIKTDSDLISTEVAEAADALLSYQGKTSGDIPEDMIVRNLDLRMGEIRADPNSLGGPPIVVNRSIFTEPPRVNFQYAEEMKARNSDAPYIVSDEEFLRNEDSFDQVCVTFYAGDGILADAQDKEVPSDEIEMVFGKDNFRFGHMSNDNDMVYIRNEALKMDFEVARSQGKYSVEVAGYVEPPQYAAGRYRGDDG